MKIYFAHDVNPRLLFKSLMDAGQPLIRIRFDGPATTRVSIACIACEDSASDSVIAGILNKIARERPATPVSAEREERLRRYFQ